MSSQSQSLPSTTTIASALRHRHLVENISAAPMNFTMHPIQEIGERTGTEEPSFQLEQKKEFDSVMKFNIEGDEERENGLEREPDDDDDETRHPSLSDLGKNIVGGGSEGADKDIDLLSFDLGLKKLIQPMGSPTSFDSDMKKSESSGKRNNVQYVFQRNLKSVN